MKIIYNSLIISTLISQIYGVLLEFTYVNVLRKSKRIPINLKIYKKSSHLNLKK